eukprot:1160644-Pelagomonas_calceolata.AAC.2
MQQADPAPILGIPKVDHFLNAWPFLNMWISRLPEVTDASQHSLGSACPGNSMSSRSAATAGAAQGWVVCQF